MARFSSSVAAIETALLALPTAAILAAFNAHSPTPTAKFSAKATGAARTAKLLSALCAERGQLVDLETMTLAPPATEEAEVAAPAKRGAPIKAVKYNVRGQGRKLLPREGSARKIAFDLMSRPEGATEAEISAATGWNPRNTYAGIRLISIANGYTITQDATGAIRIG